MPSRSALRITAALTFAAALSVAGCGGVPPHPVEWLASVLGGAAGPSDEAPLPPFVGPLQTSASHPRTTPAHAPPGASPLVAATADADSPAPRTRPTRAPARIYAAACATCHGPDAMSGQSWVNPNHWAPRLARGWDQPAPWMEEVYADVIRNGPYGGHAMPAFGREEISDEEMSALVRWLIYAPPLGGADSVKGVPPPPRPHGREILVEITDEAPWYRDDDTDGRDPFGDRRRVVLSPGEFIKVVNRGKTWHTVTNGPLDVDTGFIGYAGPDADPQSGYYYLEPAELADGANKYYCKLHPYMQLEIVTPGHDPAPLTHAHKMPIGPPPEPGLGEVWLALQTYGNPGGPDGAAGIVGAADWTVALVPGLGNNPHNGWYGTARDTNGVLRTIALFANWHDVTFTVVDAATREIVGSAPVGAAAAHVMTAPRQRHPLTGSDRWFVTIMGSNKVQELDPFYCLAAGEPTLPAVGQHDGLNGRPAFSPHGLWFSEDGDLFLTANTLAGSVSLYSLSRWVDSQGGAGVGYEVAQVATGGRSPLASNLVATGRPPAAVYRGFANNAGTDDISIFRVDSGVLTGEPIHAALSRVPAPPMLANQAGNVALSDMMADPVRWAHMPIQIAVSPPDATEHGRYLVVCNKASFNISVMPLDDHAMPTGIYTFPAGLGAHGVAFGRKAPPPGSRGVGEGVAYYVYIANTFDNYLSVYDLQRLDELIALETKGAAPPEFLPGGATEQVRVEGHAARLLTGEEIAVVPITLFSPDARGLVHVGDVAIPLPGGTPRRAYLKEHVWVDLAGYGETLLDLDVTVDTGSMGVFIAPLPPPW